jgi:hypothetical protein
MHDLLLAPRKNLLHLFFALDKEGYAGLNWGDLVWGLLVTWLVGMGRYWDHPSAKTLQYLGVGSLIYVLALTTFLFLLLWPLKIERLSFFRLLTCISLCSLPAALYAIPVEQFMAMEQARAANFWFLAIVAAWRVALIFRIFARGFDMDLDKSVPVIALSMTLIVVALNILNLEQAVFDFMGGGRRQATSSDSAYQFVIMLSWLSFLICPIALIAYAVQVYRAWFKKA